MKKINDHYSSHTWNEYDGDFDQQLEKQGVRKLFSYEPEPFTRALRDYIKCWKKIHMKNTDQISRT